MKKSFTLLALLLLFAAVTMAQRSNSDEKITPTDTVDVILDNAMENDVNNFTSSFGVFHFEGMDSNFVYEFGISVYTDQVAGSYTSSDVAWSYTSLYVNGNGKTISEIRDFTVVGNVDTCSSYFQVVTSDSVLYRMTFVRPGVHRPVPPVDTVDIEMTDPRNAIDDNIAEYGFEFEGSGFFQLEGFTQDSVFYVSVGVKSNQIEGTYTFSDLVPKYIFAHHTVGGDRKTIYMAEIRDFTITRDSTTYSTNLEFVSFDSVLYRIDYVGSKRIYSAVDHTTATEFVVYTEGDVIVVNGAEGETITVYDVAGRAIVSKQAVSDAERVDIALPGVYFVTIRNKTFKALVNRRR